MNSHWRSMINGKEGLEETYTILSSAESRFRPKVINYMRNQKEITAHARTVLVDWLADVTVLYDLSDETLHLAVNYIDRFLSQMPELSIDKLQLVGITCMFIASKYEEIDPPYASAFLDLMPDGLYSMNQLLEMERQVLKVLAFDMAAPTAKAFADMYCCQLGSTNTIRCLTEYIMELSLLDYDSFLAYNPSMIASSSLFLAAHIVPSGDDKVTDIEKITRHSQADVAGCVKKLFATLQSAHDNPLPAIRERYEKSNKHSVALIPIPELW